LPKKSTLFRALEHDTFGIFSVDKIEDVCYDKGSKFTIKNHSNFLLEGFEMICPICREEHTDSSSQEQLCGDAFCEIIHSWLQRELQISEKEVFRPKSDSRLLAEAGREQ